MYIFLEYLIFQACALSNQQQSFICTNDSTIYLGNIKTKDESQNFNITGNEIFSYITTLQLNMSSYELILSANIQNNPILILRLKESYEILFIRIILELNDQEQPKSEILINQRKKIQISSCQQIIKIYQLIEYLFVACEQEEAFIFYLFNNYKQTKDSISEAQIVQKLDKSCNCQTVIAHDTRNNIIIISKQNCTDWAVFSFDENGINIIFQPSQFNYEILKSISVNLDTFLIFNHQVYMLYDFQRKGIVLVYENLEIEIVYYYSFFSFHQSIFLILQGLSHHEYINNTLITYGTKAPKFIYEERNQIFFQFDENLSLYSFTQNQMYQQNLTFNNIFSSYPYVFGFSGEVVDVYKINAPLPFLDCNSISQKFENLFLRFVNYDYQQLQQNYMIGNQYFVSITDIEQKFTIESLIGFQSVNPAFQIETDLVKCKDNEMSYIQDCKIEFQIFWRQYIYFSNRLFAIFQTQKQKLYIQDCQNQDKIYLGQFETITIENVYVVEKFIIFLRFNRKKLTFFNSETYPNIQIQQYYLNEKVESVYSMKTRLDIIFTSCDIQQFEIKNQLLYQTKKFSTNIFYQCDKFTTYISKQLLKFNQSQLILISANFIKKINFQNEEILKIIIADQSYSQFIMLIRKNGENNFIKCSIFEDEIIKHFKLPTYMYRYTSPIHYSYNQKYLIVAAQKEDKIVKKYYLLIYNMNFEKYNILIDIVEDIDIENFTIINDNMLFFYRQKQFYYRVLGKISLSCKYLEPLIEYSKNITLPILMKSKIFDYKQIQGELILNVQNGITKLSQKDNLQLVLANQIKQFYLDPRYLLNGPVNYIYSKDYDIQQPVKLVANYLDLQCSSIVKHLCIDAKNKIIIDYFSNQTLFKYIEDIQAITVENGYIVIQNVRKNLKIIQIYSTMFQIIFEIQLEQYYLNFQVEMFSKYLFLISKSRIFIYGINKNQLSLLKEIKESQGISQIIQLKENENIFLIYENFFPKKLFKQLEIFDQNVVITEYLYLDNNYIYKNFQLFIYSLEREITYFRGKGLLIDYESSCYILDFRFYYEEKILKIGKPISILRLIKSNINLQQAVSYYQFYYFTENLFCFENSVGEIYLFNLTNSQDFQFIDSIYLTSSKNFNFQILNSTHFLLAKEDLQNISIYEIQQYVVQPIFQNKTQTSINIINSLSQIELKVETLPQEVKITIIEIICFLTGIIIISALIYFCMNLKRCYKKSANFEQKEIEI